MLQRQRAATLKASSPGDFNKGRKPRSCTRANKIRVANKADKFDSETFDVLAVQFFSQFSRCWGSETRQFSNEGLHKHK